MAWTSGTASNYQDLLARLRSFVTTEMTPAEQRWQELRWSISQSEQELILKGPGLAASDEIYVGIQTFSDKSNSTYNWSLQGYIGYQPANDFATQPGAIQESNPKLALWNTAIPYWIVANGRRIILDRMSVV